LKEAKKLGPIFSNRSTVGTLAVSRLLLASTFTLLFSLAIPAFAGAAGWVLIGPPRDKNGDYIRNVPVNGSWTQLAAFDTAAQCEDQRMTEINTYKEWFKLPEGKTKTELSQLWTQQFLLRCMPYDLWWKAQQPAR
jgi:hypothetical protein